MHTPSMIREAASTRGFSTCDPERRGVLCAMQGVAARCAAAGARAADLSSPRQRGLAPAALLPRGGGGRELGESFAGSVGP